MRISGADGGMPGATWFASRRRAPLGLAFLAATLSGLALFGCAGEYSQQVYRAPAPKKSVALPDRALLERQAEPDCTLRTSQVHGRPHGIGQTSTRIASLATERQSDGSVLLESVAPSAGDVSQGNRAVAQADPNLVQRIKLEYERDCYRRAEMRVRQRLRRLQEAVEASARAAGRPDQESP